VPEITVYSPWVGWPARAVPAKRAMIDEPSLSWYALQPKKGPEPLL